MFEDIDRVTPSESSDDRTLVFVVWARDKASPLPVHEAWRILADRYPAEPRFRLLELFEAHGAKTLFTAETFLAKVKELLDRANGKLNPEVRDLLAVVGDDLEGLGEAESASLERIRVRVGARKREDDALARRHFTRLASDLVRELHERTAGHRPLGGDGAAEKGPSAWRDAVAAATGPEIPYAATTRFAPGALVLHPKFGKGVVLSASPGKVELLFESGTRKLVGG